MSFSDESLREYGNAEKIYRGDNGTVFNRNLEYHGPFLIGQLSNGQIILFFNFVLDEHNGISFPLDYNNSHFKGESNDGITIETGNFIGEMDNITDSSQNFLECVFVISEFFVSNNEISYPLRCQALITNYLFSGELPERKCIEIDNSIVDQLSIRKIPDSDKNERTLRALHNILPTAKITFIIINEEEKNQIECFLEYLCILLSISRGTHVQWLYYELKNDGSTAVNIIHKSLINRNYNGGNKIPISSSLGSENVNKEFLSTCLINYPKFQRNQQNIRSLVNSYLSARDRDFIENKGISLAITFEKLKEFAYNNSSFEIPTKIFENEEKEILMAETFKNFIKNDLFPGIENSDIRRQLYENINGVNRSSFKNILLVILREIGITNPAQIDLLIRSRNSLVHTGQYHCVRQALNDHREASINDMYEEYITLLKFLDYIILQFFKTNLLLP